jgi:hypothetical protein
MPIQMKRPFIIVLLSLAALPSGCSKATNQSSTTITGRTDTEPTEERLFIEHAGTMNGQTSFALRNPKPIGEPCSAVGPVQDVKFNSRGRQCSLVLIFKSGFIVLLNWKLSGQDRSGVDADGPAPTGAQVVSFIERKYGDKYIVSK